MDYTYQLLIKPLLFRLEPEAAHDITVSLLKLLEQSMLAKKFLRKYFQTCGSPVSICGLNFPNQIGLAAGLDKNGQFPGISSALGFGHVEVGTVTPKPQPGNEKPRLFRIPKDKSLINRMGFNNYGAEALRRRIVKSYPKDKRSSLLGINIGKGRDTPLCDAADDYIYCFDQLVEVADYFTINVSSPNTPNLRVLQQKEFLDPLLKSLDLANSSYSKKSQNEKIPCFLKVSPDETFSSLEKIIEIALSRNISGIIATNTTNYSPGRNKHFQKGGWSGGSYLEKKANAIIKFIAQITNNNLPIIGVGGVCDANTAIRKLDLGASLVQLYTSFIYEGPRLPKEILLGIEKRNSWFT